MGAHAQDHQRPRAGLDQPAEPTGAGLGPLACAPGPLERRLERQIDREGEQSVLVEIVFDDDATVYERRAAARAMAAFGRAGQEELERVAFECDDERARQWASGGIVEHLVARGTPDDLGLLLDHYRPPFSGSIELGGDALGRFQDEASAERLRDALKSSKPSPVVREMAALAVARQDGTEAEVALRKALRDPDRFVGVRAIDGLRERGSTEHMTKLAGLVRSPSPLVRKTAFRAMTSARYGQPAFDKKVRRALASADFALRWGAVAGLGDASDDPSAEWIAERIADDLARLVAQHLPRRARRPDRHGLRRRRRALANVVGGGGRGLPRPAGRRGARRRRSPASEQGRRPEPRRVPDLDLLQRHVPHGPRRVRPRPLGIDGDRGPHRPPEGAAPRRPPQASRTGIGSDRPSIGRDQQGATSDSPHSAATLPYTNNGRR